MNPFSLGVWIYNQAHVQPLDRVKDNGTTEVGLVGKHSVCNFSCKYLWRMAVTHYREPQEVIVAVLDLGRGEQT